MGSATITTDDISTTNSASSARDVIAISKTGSGKTLAFIVSLLAGLQQTKSPTPTQQQVDESSSSTQIQIQKKHSQLKNYIYPRAIVLAPPRVLAQQIYEV